MKYHAYIKKIDSIIEEEVTIKINNTELVVFVNTCPYAIEEGTSYPVSLDITVLDDLEIEVIDECKKGFVRSDDSFVYEIKGLLTEDGIIDAGVLIDTELVKDYQYLYGKFVRIKVDRINAEFLIQ